MDWKRTWALASFQGLESINYSFLCRLIHNTPTNKRLSRILLNSPTCSPCTSIQTCNLVQAMFLCTDNCNIAQFLLQVLQKQIPNLTPERVNLLDLNLNEKFQLPFIWLFDNTHSIIWNSRIEKKSISLITTRAILEPYIKLLRKRRFRAFALIQNNECKALIDLKQNPRMASCLFGLYLIIHTKCK